jgi:hypothetical protein
VSHGPREHDMSLPDLPILGPPPFAVNAQGRYAASLVCAGSAGVHLALVPEHYREAGPALATAFAVSAVALAVAAVLLRGPVTDARRALVAAVVLLGVAGCYVLSRTSGIPVLVPDVEEVDRLGVLTTAAEVLAAALAGWPVLTREEIR